ncbi:MAG: orotidine-5'-phosphate decarboxylase [Mycoplasmatales bacterium]
MNSDNVCSVQKDVIIALDFSTKAETINFLKSLKNEKPFVKIGMELYYKYGNEIVKEIKAMGYKIFLDLKLYDIPNTVQKALKNLVELEVEFITVHTLGGPKLLSAAQTIVAGTKTKLLGVTLLTSQAIDELIQTNQTEEDVIIELAKRAQIAGLFGIICSANDIKTLRANAVTKLAFITPGIRLLGDNADDQKRVATPKNASDNGSNLIVVGRSITASSDPYLAYLEVKKQFLGE